MNKKIKGEECSNNTYIMLRFLYEFFFGTNNEKKINEMTRNELLEHLKEKEFKKMDICNPKYFNTIKSLNIYEDDLLLFEYHLYSELFKELGEYKFKTEKNLFGKRRIYVNPKFNKDSYENYNDNLNIKVDTTPLTFDLAIKEPSVPMNNNSITQKEFNETFKDSSSKIDLFGISKNMLHELPELLKMQIVNKYNEILQNPLEAKYHNIGKSSLIYKASKKGSLQDVKSFRQVIAIPNIVSHLHRILAIRLNNYLVNNSYLDLTIQKAGVSGIKMGMFEQIIKLKNIIKTVNIQKQSLCLTFIDISDAFPNTNIEKLCQILKKYNIPENLIKYIKNYYGDFTYYISTKEWKSKNIIWNRGLLQGCPMSPILFVTLLNYVLKYLESKYTDECSFNFNNSKIMFMAYMDDIVLICPDMEKTKKVYDEMEKVLMEFGLQINKSKTACMCININNPIDIGINQITKYKYLGEWLWSDGSSNNSLRILLYIVRGKLIWLDKTNYTSEQKYQYITSKLVPIIHRKFSVLYDISLEEKLKVLRIIKSFLNKWGIQNDTEINVVFDIQELLANTNDEILKNLDFEDNFYEFKEDERIVKTQLSQVIFDYDNDDIDLDLD